MSVAVNGGWMSEDGNIYPTQAEAALAKVQLDKDTLLFVAANLLARAQAERIMRDNARREGNMDVAEMHGDRAQAFIEAEAAVSALAAD